LIDTLWDDDARVRVKAAWALGMLGDPRALPPLQRLYRMEREDSRDIIEEAMDMIKQGMARDLR
jgi:HEAT repeat protein